jgi:glycosyltransferase
VQPSWLRPATKPRVCLTWGTSTSRLAGEKTFLVPKVVDWTRDLDCELIVCAVETDAAALRKHLGPDTLDVHIAENLALHMVLPGCSAIVHQGGNGTLLSAASFGVPQLALPQLPDQTFNSRQFVNSGATRMLSTDETNADAVRAGLDALLRKPEYPEAADRLRAEMRGQAAPGEIVQRLERLAAERP